MTCSGAMAHPVSALSVNDNEVYLSAMPAAQAGDNRLPSWVPATPYYAIENSLTTSSRVTRSSLESSARRVP